MVWVSRSRSPPVTAAHLPSVLYVRRIPAPLSPAARAAPGGPGPSPPPTPGVHRVHLRQVPGAHRPPPGPRG
nr:MAG: hypothetical protein DIU70_06350 [Bacillota bacterium]